MHYPNNISSKLPNTGSSIFSVMTALAHQHHAINLSQGFPDFNPDPSLCAAVERAMRQGANQYAPMPGIPLLRERIATKTETLYSAKIDPEHEVTITAGGTQALYTAITALVRDNDEVILFAPAYDSYAPAVQLAGGKPIFFDLLPPNYSIDWQQVMKLISPRTRMIVINTPHNPSGSTLTAADMAQLDKITSCSSIIILSDEVYEHIVYDGARHESILRYPALAQRAIVVSSFGKTYHTTGWKLGYVIAPHELTSEFRKVHQFTVFSVNTPMQYAYAEILQHEEHYLSLSAFYQDKRDYFRQALSGSRFELLPCSGTYFQLAAYDKITEQKDTEFTRWLTEEHGVASVPVSVFYNRHIDMNIVRFCFAKNTDTLAKSAEKLCKV
jgi:methionine transaminase